MNIQKCLVNPIKYTCFRYFREICWKNLNFDFVYIDADKVNYSNYYKKSLQLIKSSGIIAVDNVLWSDKVADDTETDISTQAISKLNNWS